MPKILGIDLGTTNSAMAIVEGGQPRIVENREGSRTTPSIIAISKSGERLVGVTAKRQAVTNPKNTIFSVKRLIGRKFKDQEVQRDLKLLPYEIREATSGGVEIKMGDHWETAESISAMILQKLKLDAEEKLGEKITEAVITVPAYFDDSQRQATKTAGEIAGFAVKRILPEPTAAALAYGLNKRKNEKIIVYDFGGGTFDVSVLEIGDDVIEVKGIGGDNHLGGDDFDQKIISYLADNFKKDEGIDLTKDIIALQRLKDAAEKAKQELSTVTETEINIPFIAQSESGPKHLYVKFTRAQLENIVREYIDRSIDLVKQTLKEAHQEISGINEIILVGGQTRMPAIQEAVKKLFGKEPHKDINPDEVVAVGAAIQGGILQGDVRDILLLDATPLSLGIETLGGVATPMISKNTTVPTSKTQIFSTAQDNQPSVEIHVLQGERPMAADNKTLGRFILEGIPPSQRGLPQIEVTFDIDANGILNVSAVDKATNKKQSIRIEATSSLSKDEVERLKREAEQFAAEDAKKKELADMRNMAETLLHSGEQALKEYGEKVNPEVKKDIEDAMGEVRKVKDGTDTAAIKSAVETLSTRLQEIGKNLRQDTSGDTPEANADQNPEQPQQ